jgi:cysteinyl-tRNA synthetase
LGLRLEQEEAALPVAPFVDLLIEVRAELRRAKQFALADRVRNGLAELGVTLEDSAGGTSWRTA